MEQYKNVLILGATNVAEKQAKRAFGLGTEIAKAFLSSPRPWKVSIMARESTAQDPKKKELLDYYTSKGANIVLGDVEKPETLSDAFQGIDLVVSVLSGIGIFSGSFPELNAIKAAHKAGVKKFVPSGWTYDAWDLPTDDIRSLKPYFAKKASLDCVKSTGMEYTLFDTIWLEYLTSINLGFDFANKIWELPAVENIRYSALSLKDIGTLVEEVLARPEISKNVKVQLATDEFSPNEMVDVFEEVSGIKFTRKYLPLEEIRQKQESLANEEAGIVWNFKRVYAEPDLQFMVYFPQPFNKVHKELAGVKTQGYRQWIKEYVKTLQD